MCQMENYQPKDINIQTKHISNGGESVLQCHQGQADGAHGFPRLNHKTDKEDFNMKHSLVALLLAACMLLGMVGCAGADEYTRFEYFYNWGALPAEYDMTSDVLATFAEKTGCIPVLNKPAEDAGTKLNLMMVNGTLPDVITFTDADLIREMINAGMVWICRSCWKPTCLTAIC